MTRNQIAWWMWAVGLVLVVLSWFDVVSTNLGWFGFAIGVFGSVISWGLRPPPADRPAEPPKIEKNDDSP